MALGTALLGRPLDIKWWSDARSHGISHARVLGEGVIEVAGLGLACVLLAGGSTPASAASVAGLFPGECQQKRRPVILKASVRVFVKVLEVEPRALAGDAKARGSSYCALTSFR